MSKWFEFDHGSWMLDYEKAAHSEDEGGVVARNVLTWLHAQGLSFPVNPNYMGFGAGMAYPELAFADALGIAASSITLMDKNFGYEALQHIRTISAEITLMDGQGIWSFLENPTEVGFGVVSFFGLDHKLRGETIPHLVSTLPRILIPGAVACMYPGGASELSNLWEEQGFTILNNGRLQVYSFQPNNP